MWGCAALGAESQCSMSYHLVQWGQSALGTPHSGWLFSLKLGCMPATWPVEVGDAGCQAARDRHHPVAWQQIAWSLARACAPLPVGADEEGCWLLGSPMLSCICSGHSPWVHGDLEDSTGSISWLLVPAASVEHYLRAGTVGSGIGFQSRRH